MNTMMNGNNGTATTSLSMDSDWIELTEEKTNLNGFLLVTVSDGDAIDDDYFHVGEFGSTHAC